MKIWRKIFLLLAAMLGTAATVAAATRCGVVIGLRSGNQSLYDENRQYVSQTVDLLKKSGLNPVLCYTEGGSAAVPGAEDIQADRLAAGLQQLATQLKKDDELWLFLYGYANATGKGVSLVTRGRRVNGAELADWLRKIPAQKYLFCFTVQSYALFEQLKKDNFFVLSAASNEGQINPPLLPGYLLRRWSESPAQPLNLLLTDAVKELNDYYIRNSMALNESAVFALDGVDYRYPFEKSVAALAAPAGFALAAVPEKPASAEKPAVATRKPAFKPFVDRDPEEKVLPATAETQQLVKQADALAVKYPDFPVVGLRLSTECTVNTDQTMKLVESQCLRINSDLGVDRYSRVTFTDKPPFSEFRLHHARLIYPDAAFTAVKMDVIPDQRGGTLYLLHFPKLRPGCIVDLEIEKSLRIGSNIPFLESGLKVQEKFPVVRRDAVFRMPPQQKLFFKTVAAAPEISAQTEAYSKVTKFAFRDLPAYEPLSFDPPGGEACARILFSGVGSWAEFAAWAHAMLDDVNRLDAATLARTRQLCAGASTDTAKVKALYEFLCNLRYDTTPSGARAFRPRTPAEVCSEGYADCKDKANALVAMAAAVGVKGYVALVNRGGRVMTDFPSWQFNHAVAYFPKLDGYPHGLWCDATDTSTVFGALPPGDVGCDAWVADGGGYFKKIVPADGRINATDRELDFRVAKDGRFTGRIKFHFSGLPDYRLRLQFGRLTPQQRRYAVQSLVNAEATGIDVVSFRCSDLAKLSAPLTLTAEVAGDSWSLVRDTLQPPMDLWSVFALPGRDRPLYLNDGQAVRATQSVKVSGAALRGRGEWRGEADGLLRLDCRCSPSGDARTVTVELVDGLIPVAAYPRLRALVKTWYVNLNHDGITKE